jgi:hypothetical protein
MNNDNNNRPFRIDDVDWAELASIGILRDELEMEGELDNLLEGRQTKVLTLQLVLLGVDVVVDATLQLVHKKGQPILEVIGITPVDQFDY